MIARAQDETDKVPQEGEIKQLVKASSERIQTAEGWRRSMEKKLKEKREKK